MLEGGPSLEGSVGTAEQRPGDALARRIETGPEIPEPRVEYGPDDKSVVFVWEGKEYTVTSDAVKVGCLIYIDVSEAQDGSDWLELKVTKITDSEPFAIESLEKATVEPKENSVKQLIKMGAVYQAFAKT